MNVTAPSASLAQALMSADASAAPEQPATNAAQFAALIAGLAMPARAPEADASPLANTSSDTRADDDAPTDDGASQQDGGGDTDPLAAALAMLPAALQQAVIAPPAAATEGAGDARPMPTIAVAAQAHTPQAGPGRFDPDTDGATSQPVAPFVLSEAEGRALGIAVGATAGAPGAATPPAGTSGTGTSGADDGNGDARAAGSAPLPAAANADPGPANPDAALRPTQTVPPQPAGGAKAADGAPKGKHQAADGIAAASSLADASGSQAPSPQPVSAAIDPGGARAVAPDGGQTPVGHALAQQHLTITSDGQWLDQLARDIATTAGADGKLSFHLNPEHLGSLTVEVTRGAEGASVRLTADTDAARTILIDAQPKLAAEARAQGVKIAETHVDLGGQNATQQGMRQQGQAQPEPMVRAARAAEVPIASVIANTSAAGQGPAAERYA